MRLKRTVAQSMLEYVILFGLLSIMAAVTLVSVFSGSGTFQNSLKTYLEGTTTE